METRPYRWALVGLGMYYTLVVLSVGGLVILRRRRIPILPLVAVGLDVVVSVALTFGQTRYRTTFEVALVLAAAVQLEWVWARLGRRGTGGATPSDDPGGHEGTRGEGTDAGGSAAGAAGSAGDGIPGDARSGAPGEEPAVAPVPTARSAASPRGGWMLPSW